MDKSGADQPAQFRGISLTTATAIVVANMVGTGVFTSLGYQLMGLHDVRSILALWFIGGIIAFSGALTYAELASHLPESGGEYRYLSRLWHPSIGFLAAWVSATIGFSAPTAVAAIAMGDYLSTAFPETPVKLVASAIVVGTSMLHSQSITLGSRFQKFFTLAKVLLMLGLIVAGFTISPPAWQATALHPDWASELLSPAFAISLIYVSYAYSGWNAATYLAGEVRQPARTVPLALLSGTVLVGLLYTFLNWSFMAMAPASSLIGKTDVGAAAVTYKWGQQAGTAMAFLIALLLVSTVSAMTFAGPRLLASLGENEKRLGTLAIRNMQGLPWMASLVQALLALFFIWTGTFETVLKFSGGILCLFTMLTTISVFRLRYLVATNKLAIPVGAAAFRLKLFPLPPLVFLLLNGYMLYYLASQEPMHLAYTFLLLGLGWLFYRFGFADA